MTVTGGERTGRRRPGARWPRPVDPTPIPVWARIVGGLEVGLAALLLAALESYLVPLRVGDSQVPLAAAMAVVGNIALTLLMYRATGGRAVSAIPVALWLLVVLVLAARRPEGDLVVPGTWPGIAFLFLGAIAGAYALGRVLAAKRPTSS